MLLNGFLGKGRKRQCRKQRFRTHWPLGVLNLTEMNKISERDRQERKAEAKDQELASFRV